MSNAIHGTHQPRGPRALLQRLRLAALGGLVALAAACGGDDPGLAGGPGGACADCGTALLTITDAPGDFQSYTVDLTSLSLVRANGTVVETLPATTRIDFAQLVDLGEVLAARQVPAGAYTAAKLRVDYTGAEIVVEDAAGGSLAVNPVDAGGAPAGEIELTVRLDGRNRLAITPGRISHLAFDLNLDASNAVDLAAGTVTVSPFIVASVVPPAGKDWRVRGRLLDVDVAGSQFTVQVRPFHHHQHSIGELEVRTTGTTTFEIDGNSYTGAPGLEQLDTLGDDAMVLAFGTLARQGFTFTAQRVLAGSSAEDLTREFLAGQVLSRMGDTLQLGAVRLHWDRLDSTDGDTDRHLGRFIAGPVALVVGPGTKVTRAGQGGGTLDATAISVGQRVQVFGDVSRGAGGAFTMDASAGLVRLGNTRLSGRVVEAASGTVTLELEGIDGLHPARFDFSGTGATPEQDADPAAYEATVASGVDTTGLAPGAWIGLFGQVAPFGMAPPDFNAVTLVDYAATRATVNVLWVPGGSATPFSALSAAGISLDTASMPLATGGIRLGGLSIALGSVSGGLKLVPASGDVPRTFAIAHRGSAGIDNFSDFADFTAALDLALDGGAKAQRLSATGTFDSPAGSFHARQLLVVLSD
ncbi:MAG TPA: DUF4382 domain-containing protein [Steroidobacteraceae bacterium]|nr:DUF4382 domain-containing protein [Steroidobacteraceae bacterium]